MSDNDHPSMYVPAPTPLELAVEEIDRLDLRVLNAETDATILRSINEVLRRQNTRLVAQLAEAVELGEGLAKVLERGMMS